MSSSVLRHSLFWFLFIMLYVIRSLLFAGPSDLAYPFGFRLLRFFFSELSFLPWKAIPFYFLFYFLIPRHIYRNRYLEAIGYFVVILLICVLGYRSMISPVSQMMYGESVDFNVYSPKRLVFTLTDILPAMALASAVKLLKGNLLFRQKEAILQQEKLKSELNFLKAQTNPHFLFNTFNNLYGLARKNDPSTAPSILKLSNLMRYILQECSARTIPIEREVKIIEDYIELEKLRYSDRLHLRFGQEIDDRRQEIAPLILLPFIENAFKHGASETRLDTFINIQLQLKDGHLQFAIENTFDGVIERLKDGVGLSNVQRQLELIYGQNHTLEIATSKDLFCVRLLIQLNRSNGW